MAKLLPITAKAEKNSHIKDLVKTTLHKKVNQEFK